MAQAGYYEARGEKEDGIAAVMHVIKNRASHPFLWPSSFKEVVAQKKQFSYTHDGSLKRGFTDNLSYVKVKAIAWDVYTGTKEDPTKGAQYYHSKNVSPSWNRNLDKTLIIGNHIFYKRKDET